MKECRRQVLRAFGFAGLGVYEGAVGAFAFHRDFHWRSTAGRFYARRAVIGPEQLDIFIPLHRGERLRQWAGLAVEHNMELEQPGGVSAFAHWLRDHGHAPPGFSDEAVAVLVAVMRESERDTLRQGA